MIRSMSGNVAAIIASEAMTPPTTVAQYVIPGIRKAMPGRGDARTYYFGCIRMPASRRIDSAFM